MSEIYYLKTAGSHCCPAEGACLDCSLGDLNESIIGLCDAFEALSFTLKKSRASGRSSFATRPWRWQREGWRRNRSFRGRRVVRCRVLRWR